MGNTPTIEELKAAIAGLEAENRQLRKFNDTFQSLYTAMVEGVCLHELVLADDGTPIDYRILDANPAYEQMTGLNRADAVGKRASQLYGTGQPPYLDIFGAVARTGRPSSFETFFEPMGRHFSISVISPRPNLFATIFFDVTDLINAAELLEESESRLRNLLEHAPDAFFAHRVDGRFVMVNEQACRSLGYTRDEFLNMTVQDVETALTPAEARSIWEQVMTGRSVTFEGRHRRKDGTVFPAEVKISAFTSGNEPLVFGFARDISNRQRYAEERERMQTQLAQAQKMEAMGTLAGGIAHDFNNLLMGIMGRTSLMANDPDAARQQREHIDGIDACVKSAMSLTKQLLGIARGGKYEVQITDANRLIADTLEMFARTKKEITTRTDLADTLNAVAVDRNQISQVLLNIFVNAWHAMPAGGELSLSTQNVAFADGQAAVMHIAPGRYVEIRITDNGIGIPLDIQHRIFDPFFTTKEKGRGTGLGLASAYGIIKNHGGHITVDSAPGQGATFAIYLPASQAAPPREAPQEAAPIPGTGTVLLVDDESNIIEIGRLMLERLGYTVFTASSGTDALAIFKAHQEDIDVVVLDMIMPGKSGGETFDALRAVDPACRVILSSGYSINGQATDILNRGCNGFIQKPFSLAQLSQKVSEVLAPSGPGKS